MPSEHFRLPLLVISVLGACLWAAQADSKEVKQRQVTRSNLLSLLMAFSGCYCLVAWDKNNIHTKRLRKGKRFQGQKEEQLSVQTVLPALSLPVY